MTDVIKPAYALSIWANSDFLFLELPNPLGQKAHQLKLPLDVYSLTHLLMILQDRRDATKLGEVGDPTQHQSNETIKEMQRLHAGFDGVVKKPAKKMELTPALSLSVKDVIRRFVTV